MRNLAAAAAATLAACSTAPANPPVVGQTGYICRNAGLDRFAGQPATSELGAEMLGATGARVLRWVRPGMMVTMEFRQDRLTVHLGADGRVESAACG
jgi:hypothetical protein